MQYRSSTLDGRELLWRLYHDNREYARFHENMRAVGTNVIAGSAAILVGFITHDNKLTLLDLPVCAFLILIGMFGAIFSSKQYERNRLHANRAAHYLYEIDKAFEEYDYASIKTAII